MDETEKILQDKELMRLIRRARKKGSKCSPYKPLVTKAKGFRSSRYKGPPRYRDSSHKTTRS